MCMHRTAHHIQHSNHTLHHSEPLYFFESTLFQQNSVVEVYAWKDPSPENDKRSPQASAVRQPSWPTTQLKDTAHTAAIPLCRAHLSPPTRTARNTSWLRPPWRQNHKTHTVVCRGDFHHLLHMRCLRRVRGRPTIQQKQLAHPLL